MANLFFPQMMSGAIAQYPIQKTRAVRTTKNVMLDGTMLLSSDLNSNPQASRLIWQLSYTGLEVSDMQAIKTHFDICCGKFRGFTFIDPTDNMLAYSSDLAAPKWLRGTIDVISGASDPAGGDQGFVLTNVGQTTQQIAQSLMVPANYQYCFSVYLRCARAEEVTLVRSGKGASSSTAVVTGPSWTRVCSSGRLNDEGTSFTVGILLTPGQQLTVYGLQLEPQLQPSRYRATKQAGGVYPNAHWAVEEIPIVAEATDLFATSFSIETIF